MTREEQNKIMRQAYLLLRIVEENVRDVEEDIYHEMCKASANGNTKKEKHYAKLEDLICPVFNSNLNSAILRVGDFVDLNKEIENEN